MASFSADDLIVTGGSVFEVIPVQHTNDYFVWLAIAPGAGSFGVSIKSGESQSLSFFSTHEHVPRLRLLLGSEYCPMHLRFNALPRSFLR